MSGSRGSTAQDMVRRCVVIILRPAACRAPRPVVASGLKPAEMSRALEALHRIPINHRTVRSASARHSRTEQPMDATDAFNEVQYLFSYCSACDLGIIRQQLPPSKHECKFSARVLLPRELLHQSCNVTLFHTPSHFMNDRWTP